MFVSTSDKKIIEKASLLINLDTKPKPEIMKDYNKRLIKK